MPAGWEDDGSSASPLTQVPHVAWPHPRRDETAFALVTSLLRRCYACFSSAAPRPSSGRPEQRRRAAKRALPGVTRRATTGGCSCIRRRGGPPPAMSEVEGCPPEPVLALSAHFVRTDALRQAARGASRSAFDRHCVPRPTPTRMPRRGPRLAAPAVARWCDRALAWSRRSLGGGGLLNAQI